MEWEATWNLQLPKKTPATEKHLISASRPTHFICQPIRMPSLRWSLKAISGMDIIRSKV